MFENIQRIPDVVMVGERQARPEGVEGCFALEDVRVETVPGMDGMAVRVTAGDAPVRKVRLRWHCAARLCGRVLGAAGGLRHRPDLGKGVEGSQQGSWVSQACIKKWSACREAG